MQLTPESRAHELEELTQIYVNRGLCHETAKQVCMLFSSHGFGEL